jgi:predicted ATPase
MRGENSPAKKITLRLTDAEAETLLRKGKAKGFPTLTEAARDALVESIRQENSLSQQIVWHLDSFARRLAEMEAVQRRELEQRDRMAQDILAILSQSVETTTRLTDAVSRMQERL